MPSRPKTLEEVRQVTDAFASHDKRPRPHQGIACGNQPPRVAFPHLPLLPRVPDLVNPDAWGSDVKGQQRVAAGQSPGLCEGGFAPILHLTQARWPNGDLVHSGHRAAFAGRLSSGVSSLTATQRLPSTIFP